MFNSWLEVKGVGVSLVFSLFAATTKSETATFSKFCPLI